MRGTLLVATMMALFGTIGSFGVNAAENEGECPFEQDDVQVRIFGIATGFDPVCVRTTSGSSITWTNNDNAFGGVDHDPQSSDTPAPQGRCFWAGNDFGALGLGDTYTVTFHYDGTTVTSEWVHPSTGRVTVRDCADALDPTLTTASTATIEYRCRIHPTTMNGLIQIEA